MIVATALTCLAINLYHEARGEPVIGQYAVAAVVMNRADRDPTKVCEVTFAPKQFSWTSSVRKTASGWFVPKAMQPQDEAAWNTAQKIAAVMVAGRMGSWGEGMTYYHATRARPYWSRIFTRVRTVGNHIFYTSIR